MLELMTRGVAPKEEDSLNDDERRLLEKERQRKEPQWKLKMKVLANGADVTKSSSKGKEKFEAKQLAASNSNTQEMPSLTFDEIPSTGLHLTNDGSRTDVDMVEANTEDSTIVSESLRKSIFIALHFVHAVE